MDTQVEWTNLLIDVAIAKNYMAIISDSPLNNIKEVDSVIVSGLLIRAVSILDLSVDKYITNRNLKFDPKVKNPRLFDRLVLLDSKGLLLDYKDIDKWRDRRNAVGHEINEHYSWTELDLCTKSIFRELKNLVMLQKHPTLTIKKTRQRVAPTIQGITIEQDIIVAVHEGQTIYYEFGWKVRV